MSTKGSRIKEAREKIGMSQTDMADRIGVSKQTLYKYENDIITNIPSDKIEEISALTGVSPAYIMGWETNQLPSEVIKLQTKNLPILGSVACGKPIFDPSDGVQIKVPSSFHADFGLYARGDSMIGADIHDGDLVFFIQQPTVENGQIAAVFIDDEVTLKRVYYQQGERLVLQAENSSVPPIIIEGPDLNQVHIIGRAIAKQSAVI